MDLELKLEKQNKKKNKSETAIARTKKEISQIQDLFDPLTHTPLFRTIKFAKKKRGDTGQKRKAEAFKCSAASSAFKYPKAMMSGLLGRDVVFYDTRKTQCNAVANELPKLGLKVSDENIAKYVTHNSVTTLRKHYLSNKNEDKKFAASEAFSILQHASEAGFNEKQFKTG